MFPSLLDCSQTPLEWPIVRRWPLVAPRWSERYILTWISTGKADRDQSSINWNQLLTRHPSPSFMSSYEVADTGRPVFPAIPHWFHYEAQCVASELENRKGGGGKLFFFFEELL